MRWTFLFLLTACGGKLLVENTDGGADASNSNDPLGGGGQLKKGPCVFTPAFMPRDMPPIANPPVMGIGVSSGTPKSFSIACSGTAADTFYYDRDGRVERDGRHAIDHGNDEANNERAPPV